MASKGLDVPDTHVLAIASHVTSGYVGNTMATFCMQTLGCEVSAIHTVNYSNHVAYRTFRGRKTPPDEIAELYAGLKVAHLDKFDMILSGYHASAAQVKELGKIARDAKDRSRTRPGSFFWVLDPVMGDNGRIYVAQETVPEYKALLKDADLILPNQFEAELLSDVKITDWISLGKAVGRLHKTHGLPHVIITSVRLPDTAAGMPVDGQEKEPGKTKLSVIGSTADEEGKPRLFKISVPALPVFFSGTGDMFAALLVARLRQAAKDANVDTVASWSSPDNVQAQDLPLAKAAEKVLASMHAVLKDTAEHHKAVAKKLDAEVELDVGKDGEAAKEKEMEKHLTLTRAAEVRVVRNTRSLRHPPDLEHFKAEAIDVELPEDSAGD